MWSGCFDCTHKLHPVGQKLFVVASMCNWLMAISCGKLPGNLLFHVSLSPKSGQLPAKLSYGIRCAPLVKLSVPVVKFDAGDGALFVFTNKRRTGLKVLNGGELRRDLGLLYYASPLPNGGTGQPMVSATARRSSASPSVTWPSAKAAEAQA